MLLCWCGSEARLKPKTNQDQLSNRMHNAVEVKSDERKDDLFTLDEVLMLEVFVSGIYKSVCLRYFGTPLKEPTLKHWLEHVHVWKCAMRHCFVSVRDSISYIFHPFSPFF